MKSFLLNLVITAIAIGVAAYLIPGVIVDGVGTAILVALVLAVLNATLGRILRVLTLPLNVLTLGLIGFIVGVLMVMLTDSLITGFELENFRIAIVFSVIL